MSEPKKSYPNSALVFTNRDKEGEKDPDIKGSGEINCPHCQRGFALWVNGWRNEGAKGKYLRLTLRAKDDRPARDPDPKPSKPYTPGPIDPPRRKDEDDQSIPF